MRKLVAYRLLRRGTSNPTSSCTCHASLPPRSCPLAFHTFAYHLRGLAQQGGGGKGLLIAATLAASHSSCLATCNSRSSSSSSGSSGSNGGPSRFRCLGTTRLLEEVASCQGRGGGEWWEKGGEQRLLTISCHFLHFLVHCFRLLLGFAFLFTAVCLPSPFPS